MDKLDMKSLEVVNKNIEKIGELFPNVVKESENDLAIDFDALKQELSEVIVDGNKEKYQLTWPGKKEAILNANTPTTNTLRLLKEKSVNFDTTENIYIEGDNLEVLKILQESYLNKIKCIYIDPPYNTGNDFIYNDNFSKNYSDELLESGQVDDFGNRLVTNNQANGRYHSDWLSMMYPRLKLARNLLSPDGVIFISIDDNELYSLKKMSDEIFGESNFISNLVVVSAPAGTQSSNDFAVQQSYCLVYRKTSQFNTSYIELSDAEKEEKYKYDSDDKGNYYIERLWKRGMGGKKEDVPSLHFPVYFNSNTNSIYIDGEDFQKNANLITIIPYQSAGVLGRWTWSREKMINEKENLIVVKVAGEYKLHKKVYETDEKGRRPGSIIESKIGRTELGSLEIKNLFGSKVFDYPKFSNLIKYFIAMQGDKKGIVLDFFSGSATTAHATMQLNAEDNGNRKYIMVQLSEETDEKSEAYKAGYKNICEIGQERIRRAAKKIKEETNADIDYGFRVYKLDSSNMKDVYYTAGEYSQDQLKLFESNIVEDRTSEDLLTQVMLDLGLKLDLKINEKELKNNKIYFVEENSLVACFDDNFNIDNIEEICKVKPLKLVFKDSCFRTDNDKINVSERIKKLSPETKISVI